MDSTMSPKVKTTKGKKVETLSLAHNTFGGKRACWSSGMGLGRFISKSITHMDLHKANKKLISA